MGKNQNTITMYNLTKNKNSKNCFYVTIFLSVHINSYIDLLSVIIIKKF